jgi:hypothetical protein
MGAIGVIVIGVIVIGVIVIGVIGVILHYKLEKIVSFINNSPFFFDSNVPCSMISCILFDEYSVFSDMGFLFTNLTIA